MSSELDAELFGTQPQVAASAPVAGPPAAPSLDPNGGPAESAAAASTTEPGKDVTFKNIVKDVATGVSEVFPAITAGARAGVNESIKTASEVANVIGDQLDLPPQTKAVPEIPELWGEPTSNTGHMIKGVTQFVVGYATGGRVLKALKIGGGALGIGGTIAKSAALSGWSGATAFDPYERRLSNMMQESPTFSNVVTEFLAADDMDSRALARLKSGAENMGLGVPVDALAASLRGLKAWRSGNREAAVEYAQQAEDVMTAYHGSKHDFTEFDLSKAGTGEGSQAFGHGVYVAENEGVAKFYAHSTGQNTSTKISPELMAALKAEDYLGFDRAGEAVAEMRRSPKWAEQFGVAPDSPLVSAFDNHVETSAKANGSNLYEVRVKHKPEEMLNWDSPLNEQSPEVQKAVAEVYKKVSPDLNIDASEVIGTLRGEDIYRTISQRAGGDAAASAALADAGVPGLRFLDAGSRGGDAATGTRNMVLFNAKSAEVVSKNGEAIRAPEPAPPPQSPYDPEPTITRPTGVVETYQQKTYSPQELDELRQTWNDATHNGENIDTNAGSIVYKNMSTIENSNDAKAFANVLGVTNTEAYEKAIGRPMTHEESIAKARQDVSALADITGTDVDEVFNQMAGDLTNIKQVVTRINGYRTLAETYAKSASDLARMITSGDASAFGGNMHTLYSEFAKKTAILASIDPLVEGIKSNLGRGLSMVGAKVGPEAGGAMLNASDKAGIEALAARMALTSDAKTAFKVTSDSFGRKLMDTHNEYWINALLSGPKTHAVNVASAVIKSALVMPTEQMLAGMIGRDMAAFRQGADMWVGFAMSMRDSMKLANQALKNGDAILDQSHMGLGEAGGGAVKKAITAEAAGVATDTPIGALINGLGNLVRLPSRLLTTEDEMMKQLNYRAYLYSTGMREARGLNIPTAEIPEFLEQHMARAFDVDGKGINPQALEYARDATFTKDLDVATNSGKSSLGETMQGIAQDHPWFRAVLPFVRVPTNILRDAVDHTPGMNMLRKEFRDEFYAGGERSRLAYAKTAVGGGLWASAAALAFNGQITGAGPPEPNARRLLMESGWQPNSVKLIGEDGKAAYLDYSRFEPYATFFSMVASYAENTSNMEAWQTEDIASSMVLALSKNIESKTYLQGLTEFLDMIHTKDVNQGSAALRKRFGSYIPSAQAAFNGRDYLLEPFTLLQAAQARTSEYEKVDAKRNVLGEKVAVPLGFGGDFSPIAMSPGSRQDAVLAELARLNMVHKGGLSYPGKTLEGVDLTGLKVGETSARDRLQALTSTVQIGGMTLREYMTDMFNSDAYKTQMTDGDPDHDGSRMFRVGAVLQRFRQAAGRELQLENPAILEAVQAERAKKIEILRFGAPLAK